MFPCSRVRILAITISLVIFFSTVQAAADAKSHAGQIDELISLLHERGQFNGSILAAEDGQVIYEKGFGMANIESSVPNEVDSKFIIGSITKTFTAVMIMQLAEEGRLGLDDPVTKHLPWYPADTGDRITIKHLLNHRSGIPNHMRDIPEFRGDTQYAWFRHYKPEELVGIFSGLDLKFEPGEKFEYCNSGFYLLGVIIEAVTGKSYAEALRSMILEPAGMDDTGYYSSYRDIVDKRARGYYDFGFSGFRNARYVDPTVLYSAGGMHSTVADLFLYDQALKSEKLLPAESRDRMYEMLFERPNTGAGYGLGWSVGKTFVSESIDSIGYVGHAGDGPGYFGWMNSYDDGNFIVFLTNTNTFNIFTARFILDDILRILHDLPWDRTPPFGIGRAIQPVIEEKGVKAGISEYYRLKREAPEDYIFLPPELNRLGYYLLRNGQINDAIAIFTLNRDEYPEVANVFDSLGEAYIKAGKKDLAIENYEKVLLLDPDSKNAAAMLEKLRKE